MHWDCFEIITMWISHIWFYRCYSINNHDVVVIVIWPIYMLSDNSQRDRIYRFIGKRIAKSNTNTNNNSNNEKKAQRIDQKREQLFSIKALDCLSINKLSGIIKAIFGTHQIALCYVWHNSMVTTAVFSFILSVSPFILYTKLFDITSNTCSMEIPFVTLNLTVKHPVFNNIITVLVILMGI